MCTIEDISKALTKCALGELYLDNKESTTYLKDGVSKLVQFGLISLLEKYGENPTPREDKVNEQLPGILGAPSPPPQPQPKPETGSVCDFIRAIQGYTEKKENIEVIAQVINQLLKSSK